MRRREVVIMAAASAMAAPMRTVAQEPSRPKVVFLSSGSPEGWAPLLQAFLMGLAEAGYIDGRDVSVEYAWAAGHYERLPAMAADVVARHASVIIAAGGAVTALAAKGATSTVPIVVVIGDDPVRFGIVGNLGHPGQNITGVTLFIDVLTPKRFEILDRLLPHSRLAMLVNPDNPNAQREADAALEAARQGERELRIFSARNADELASAFGEMAETRELGLMIGTDTYFFIARSRLVELASQHAIPTVYFQREFALRGGLVSYGATLTEEHRIAGRYTGRILSGERPGDLPIVQRSKFELVVNLKAAKALGLTIPPSLLARADEVIE